MKVCMVCGKELPDDYTKDKCKKCLKKSYASKVIIKLLEVVSPEIPFKKEDLKELGLLDFQILDYIWTLQEFNLIDENKTNNTFSLKDEDTLNKFVTKWGDPKKLEEASSKSHTKLSKTCALCGKTLPISEFTETLNGVDNYCKNCKKLMRTAKGLNNLLEHINIGTSFKKEDLNEFITNPIMIEGTIWDLQDSNLINFNKLTNEYTIKEKTIIEDFLNKYLIDEEKISIPKEVEVNEESIETDENDILYFISEKTRDYFEIISKGTIKNEEIFSTISELEILEDSLKRIMTYKKDNNSTEIIVELNNNINKLNTIEKQLKELGWKKLG